MLAAALLLALASVAPPPAPCPVERAGYILSGQPDFTAEFHPVASNVDWPSGVALAIHSAKTGRTWWFLPWGGGTDGRQHMRWVRVAGDGLDGLRISADQDFLAVDQMFEFIADLPKMGRVGPMHFVLPGLDRQLWYASPIKERENMRQAFFHLLQCGTTPKPPVDLALPKVG